MPAAKRRLIRRLWGAECEQRTLDSDLNQALQEMTAAMRAIRLLADYLERNPNALLYGKGGDRR